MTDREIMQQALDDICSAKLCEFNSMSSRHEMIRLLDRAITALSERLAQPVQKPKPSATGPAELWLQLHGDSLSDEPVDFTDDTVTWCWHQIFDSDVRYVRADLAAQQPVFHLRSHGDVSAEELERLAQPEGAISPHLPGICCKTGTCDREQPVQEPWPDEPPGHIAGGVQEPVAICEYCEKERPVVQAEGKPWVGLTDEAIWLEYQRFWPFHPAEEPTLAKDIAKFARAIEAKLREKNGGNT